PLVNAISGRGNVYLYDGTLQTRRRSSPEWRAVHQVFADRRRARELPAPPPRVPRLRFVR
nr:hypothetical protein [Candidatus Eremiobacteraeota bacterium]